MTSSTSKSLPSQLNEIAITSEQLEKSVADVWDTTSTTRQAQITTCVREAAHLLYAEGFQSDTRFSFVEKLVSKCWKQLNSIQLLLDVQCDPVPYKKEELVRVLKAIKITADILRCTKNPNQKNETGVVPLKGLEHLSGCPCVLPLFNGNPGKVGGDKAAEILGEDFFVNTPILRCFDTAVTITLQTNNEYRMDLVPNWRGVVARHSWLPECFPTDLIPTILDYLVEPASSWIAQRDANMATCTLLPPKMTMSADEGSAALNKQIRDFGKAGLRPELQTNWLGVTKFGMVGHVTLTHPSRHELLFVARKDRPLVYYPAVRLGSDAKNYTISSTGMEFISFQIIGETIIINGINAQHTQSTLGISVTDGKEFTDK